MFPFNFIDVGEVKKLIRGEKFRRGKRKGERLIDGWCGKKKRHDKKAHPL